MEHNLYAVVVVIEELHPADLIEDRVVVIINHIMRGDWRKSVPFQCQDTTLQKDVVFFGQKLVRTWQCAVFSACRHKVSRCWIGARIHEPVGTDGMVEKPGTDSVLNLCHCVSELFCDSLALESINGI